MKKDEGLLGIIGGTGFYSLPDVEIQEEREVTTPFGAPSASISLGKWHGERIAFLPRHGLKHQILPSEINYRANLWAFKSVGVRRVISVSAVGSLREEMPPGEIAIPHQYLDWTKGRREPSFFGKGLVAHISSAEPTCALQEKFLLEASQVADVRLHSKKAYACVEGPRLGTRAESFFLRGAGCDLVGMTGIPEAFLAREAQLSYNTLAVVTDYDCWREDPNEHVTVDLVIEQYKKSLAKVQRVLSEYCKMEKNWESGSPAWESLAHAVLTQEDALGSSQKEVLNFLRS